MNWDELNEYYKNSINQTQQQINNLQAEKQNAINEYETGYNNQLQIYDGYNIDNEHIYSYKSPTTNNIQLYMFYWVCIFYQLSLYRF